MIKGTPAPVNNQTAIPWDDMNPKVTFLKLKSSTGGYRNYVPVTDQAELGDPTFDPDGIILDIWGNNIDQYLLDLASDRIFHMKHFRCDGEIEGEKSGDIRALIAMFI